MDDKHYSKFLNIIKNLHINIPFANMLEYMPKYAKILKEPLSKVKKIGEQEAVMLTKGSSAL